MPTAAETIDALEAESVVQTRSQSGTVVTSTIDVDAVIVSIESELVVGTFETDSSTYKPAGGATVDQIAADVMFDDRLESQGDGR